MGTQSSLLRRFRQRRIGTLIGTLLVAGWLGSDASNYRPLLVGFACVLALAAWFCLRTPGPVLENRGRFPLAPLANLWRDPAFGWISCTWTLVGSAHLATAPLRTEFIGNPRYGPAHEPWLVVLLVTGISEAFRVLTLPFWGRLFDRMNLVTLLFILFGFYGASIVLFFFPSLHFQIVSSILLGLGAGGTEIAWGLWVTRFAPEKRTAEYMSVHTFLTGCRGLVAPMAAYAILQRLDIRFISWIGAGMVVVALFLLAILSSRVNRMSRK